ncbi:MAG: hypothetical protein M0Z69_15840, partial [Actinomycetota bacterium]|nr:hypothetical protein [Actinomycetota bacterium]
MTRVRRAVHLRARRKRAAVLVAAAVAAVASASIPPALGGFGASVANTGGSARTGSLLLAASSGGSSECNQAAAGTAITSANSSPCTGTLLPAGVLPSSGTSSLSTTITDEGSLAGQSASLEAGTCGAAELADASNPADPMLVRSTVSFAQPGPLAGGTGLGLAGTDGYASDVADAPGPSSTSFTMAIWFD